MIKTYKDTPIMGYPQKTDAYTSNVLEKMRSELHATAELHEDGDYYLYEEGYRQHGQDFVADGEKAYQQGLEDGRKQGVAIDGNKRYWAGYHAAQEDGKKMYQKGLEDAWSAARKIMLPFDGCLKSEELEEIFGANMGIRTILKTFSASEAIEKIREYDKEQQDNEIKVGDEVVYRGEKAVILWVNGDYIKIMYSDGTTNHTHPDSTTKTGRHFDGIEETMKRMRSEA